MSAAETLSGITGIPRKEVDEIFQMVKANSKQLEGCAVPHDFTPFGERPIFRKERCSKCGGEVDAIAAMWYKRGLKHGGAQ